MRIGFLTLWFERGQAHVTRTLRSALLSQGAGVHVFARTGEMYGEPQLETSGSWDVPHLVHWPTFAVPPERLAAWVRDNDLDVVVFNEEHDWDLVRAVRDAGARAATWLDFYTEAWNPLMPLYDAVLCGSQRALGCVPDHPGAAHVGWAVDTELFSPPVGDRPFTFFHNAGWLGLNHRKQTPLCLLAFDALAEAVPDATLLVHAQAPIQDLPPVARRIAREHPRVTYRIETVPAPGLYHLGRTLLFPSKLEGLGLPLFEALACGMPVVAADAPPMNEFVQQGQTGLLIPVVERRDRGDGIAFPEELLDWKGFALACAQLATDPERVDRMGRAARDHALEHLGIEALGERVLSALASP